MLSSKDNSKLLESLLTIHLAPISKAEIKRARKEYKDVIGKDYSFSEAVLEAHLIKA